jgi:hypothetical protein
MSVWWTSKKSWPENVAAEFVTRNDATGVGSPRLAITGVSELLDYLCRVGRFILIDSFNSRAFRTIAGVVRFSSRAIIDAG